MTFACYSFIADEILKRKSQRKLADVHIPDNTVSLRLGTCGEN